MLEYSGVFHDAGVAMGGVTNAKEPIEVKNWFQHVTDDAHDIQLHQLHRMAGTVEIKVSWDGKVDVAQKVNNWDDANKNFGLILGQNHERQY